MLKAWYLEAEHIVIESASEHWLDIAQDDDEWV